MTTILEWRYRLMRNWLVFLPAIGICTTAVLFLFVSFCLLGRITKSCDFYNFQVRSPVEKKDGDENGRAKEHDGMIGVRRAFNHGTIQEIIQKFPCRSRNLDVQTRILGFLTTWSVMLMIQGALAVFVLALLVRVLWMHWSSKRFKEILWVPGIMIGVSVTLIIVASETGYASLSLGKSVNGLLQTEARKALELDFEIEVLTFIGNVSIVVVIVLAPLSLCVLLSSPDNQARRFQQFQQLIYWIAFLLVVGVVQVTYQNRMPALFFDDEFNVQHIGQMASGAGLLIGGVFTVALGLVFLPTGFVLGRHLPPTDGPGQTDRKGAWLAEVAAVLAPLLTALPISKLFDIAS